MNAESAVFEQTGGYRVGRNAWLAFNASTPFGALRIRAGSIVLQCIASSYTFPAEAISRLSLYDGLFSSGLRIEHTIADYPQFIVFWSSNLEKLQEHLHATGFHLSN